MRRRRCRRRGHGVASVGTGIRAGGEGAGVAVGVGSGASHRPPPPPPPPPLPVHADSNTRKLHTPCAAYLPQTVLRAKPGQAMMTGDVKQTRQEVQQGLVSAKVISLLVVKALPVFLHNPTDSSIFSSSIFWRYSSMYILEEKLEEKYSFLQLSRFPPTSSPATRRRPAAPPCSDANALAHLCCCQCA